jgi:hypothetical protein
MVDKTVLTVTFSLNTNMERITTKSKLERSTAETFEASPILRDAK